MNSAIELEPRLTSSKYFAKKLDLKAIESEFSTRISFKESKGIDKISVSKFEKNKKEHFNIIRQKCLSSTYKFSPYLEKLKLKSRNKKPRVISTATIRDKVVLSILKDVLHNAFPECIGKKLPNSYIRDIRSIHFDKSANQINFLKVDIEKFFDTIKHDILLKKLKSRIRSSQVLILIERAITNPTVNSGYRRQDRLTLRNTEGVPQGLAISNILANIYLLKFDQISSAHKCHYFRYVDDIIMLSSEMTADKMYSKVVRELDKIKLSLNVDKNKKGIYSDEFEYLGYRLNYPLISVRQSTVNLFIQKIAAKFTWFNYRLSDASLPAWMQSDPSLLRNRFISLINEKITGAIDEKKKYGWIFYFIEINDLALLFQLDLVINNLFKRQKAFGYSKPPEIKSFVRAYYQARHNPSAGYIHNYNSYITLEQKEKLLKKYGVLNPNITYSPSEIELKYSKFKFDNLLELDLDFGKLY